jgi:hypothetical protein
MDLLSCRFEFALFCFGFVCHVELFLSRTSVGCVTRVCAACAIKFGGGWDRNVCDSPRSGLSAST